MYFLVSKCLDTKDKVVKLGIYESESKKYGMVPQKVMKEKLGGKKYKVAGVENRNGYLAYELYLKGERKHNCYMLPTIDEDGNVIENKDIKVLVDYDLNTNKHILFNSDGSLLYINGDIDVDTRDDIVRAQCGKMIKTRKENSLENWAKHSGEYGALLLSEFDYEKNDFTPSEVTFSSSKPVHWRCEHGHEFVIDLNSRTWCKSKCKKCQEIERLKALDKYLSKNSQTLYDWCMEHDLYGQQLIEEFDNGGNNVDMHKITYGSEIPVNWKCKKCGKVFERSPHRRTYEPSYCPDCYIYGTSYPEQLIYLTFKRFYPDTQNRDKLFKDRYKFGVEYDVTVASKNLYIEYNGEYWHEGKEERDELKKTVCDEYGVKFIRIIEEGKGQEGIRYRHDGEFSEIRFDYTGRQDKEQKVLDIIDNILSGLEDRHSLSEINETDMILIKDEALKRTRNIA